MLRHSSDCVTSFSHLVGLLNLGVHGRGRGLLSLVVLFLLLHDAVDDDCDRADAEDEAKDGHGGLEHECGQGNAQHQSDSSTGNENARNPAAEAHDDVENEHASADDVFCRRVVVPAGGARIVRGADPPCARTRHGAQITARACALVTG